MKVAVVRFVFCLCALAILLAGCDSASTAETPDPDQNPAEPADPGALVVSSIDPRDTYLYIDEEDTTGEPFIFDLAAEGITPGTTLNLKRIGELQVKEPEAENFTSTKMIGVFSATDTLLPPLQLNRVPDAIDAGEDYITNPTFIDGEPTDIPEDFFIDDLQITVPEGSQYLFIATPDVLYRDNFDKDDDYKIEIKVVD